MLRRRAPGAGSPLLGRHTRRGVTIIEVLFAIGIVIVGLLGVASLLPMAARNAELSNEAAEGQAYAQRYYAEFVSRGFSDSRNWRWFDDNPAMGNKTFSTAFNNAVEIPSSSNAGGNVSTAFRHAICIDPGFFADPLSVLEVNGSSFGANQAYRPGLFPYYQDSFDPTSNPFAPSFLAAPPALRRSEQARVVRQAALTFASLAITHGAPFEAAHDALEQAWTELDSKPEGGGR